MHSDSMMLGNQAEFPRGLGIWLTLFLYHNEGELPAHIPAPNLPRKTEVVPAVALWGSLTEASPPL